MATRRKNRTGAGGIAVLAFPLDLLRELNFVDTPGTNAVIREHEELTRDFVPRSSLVVFVTSAERPFTESARQFLGHIREWGKKAGRKRFAALVSSLEFSAQAAQRGDRWIGGASLDQFRPAAAGVAR